MDGWVGEGGTRVKEGGGRVQLAPGGIITILVVLLASRLKRERTNWLKS